jgi:hypothetical protein
MTQELAAVLQQQCSSSWRVIAKEKSTKIALFSFEFAHIRLAAAAEAAAAAVESEVGRPSLLDCSSAKKEKKKKKNSRHKNSVRKFRENVGGV